MGVDIIGVHDGQWEWIGIILHDGGPTGDTKAVVSRAKTSRMLRVRNCLRIFMALSFHYLMNMVGCDVYCNEQKTWFYKLFSNFISILCRMQFAFEVVICVVNLELDPHGQMV